MCTYMYYVQARITSRYMYVHVHVCDIVDTYTVYIYTAQLLCGIQKSANLSKALTYSNTVAKKGNLLFQIEK